MSEQIRIRRDTATNLATVIPADGEMAYNTTDDRLHMGDGSTYGGIPHANYRDVQNNVFTYATAGGTANALTLTLDPAPASYAIGMKIRFKASSNNSASATIDVNGLGAKTLQRFTLGTLGNLSANDIVSGGIYEAIYDGTYFQMYGLEGGGITDVSQGDLNTSSGTVGGAASGTHYTLPGGQYGFYPQTRKTSSTPDLVAYIAESETYGGTIGTSFVTRILLRTSNPSAGLDRQVYAQQRYITSSPPFDMGDGDAHGFFFALVNSNGEIQEHYIADVPPWGYNGPTDIRACKICPNTGKKYRRVAKKRTLEEIMDGAKIEYELEEITQKIKNADMDILGNPFSNYSPDLSVVLIDPMDDRIGRIVEHQNMQEGSSEVIRAITDGKIKVDNSVLSKRKGPKGVPIHRLKFKYSG